MTQTYSVAPTGQQHSSPGQSDAVKPRSVALGEANTAHAALKGRNRNSIGLTLKPFLVLFMAGTVSAAPESSLFNGKDLSGWHADVPSKDKNPDLGPSFTVRDGLLVSLGEPRGHLITDKAYRDYRLDVEYRFPQSGGNCGVLVHASKPRALSDMFPQSIEVQMQAGQAGDFWCIQENIEVPDMESRRPRREGQEYGGGPSNARRILNLTDDSEKPLGQWNTMRIECRGREIKVWVNGDMVNHGSNCTAEQGRIAIQAEGTEVEFRKVALTPLSDDSATSREQGAGRVFGD